MRSENTWLIIGGILAIIVVIGAYREFRPPARSEARSVTRENCPPSG